MERKIIENCSKKRIFSDDPNKGHELVNQKIYDFCKNIVKIFNLSWLYDFDIMFNKLNEPCLLEINPRKSVKFNYFTDGKDTLN